MSPLTFLSINISVEMYASKLDVSLPILHVSFHAIDNRVEGITALLDGQGCTLAAPSGLWYLIFALGCLFFHTNHMLGTQDFTASGSLQFLLQHSLDGVNFIYNFFFYQELHFMPKICAGFKPEERLQNLAFDAIFINQ